MTNTQAFLLGVMVAWTPSLVVLAWLALRSPQEADEQRLSEPRTN